MYAIDQTTANLLLRAVELALLEFERISYQKKADPEVLKCLRLAVERAKRTPKT